MAVRANTGQSPNPVLMVGQRQIRFTGIKPAIGCNSGPTFNGIGWVGLNSVHEVHLIDAYTDLSEDVTVRSGVKKTRGSTFHWQVLYFFFQFNSVCLFMLETYIHANKYKNAKETCKRLMISRFDAGHPSI